MQQIRQYRVTYCKDCQYMTDIVETAQTPDEIRSWYDRYQAVTAIFSITEYADVIDRGRKVLRI